MGAPEGRGTGLGEPRFGLSFMRQKILMLPMCPQGNRVLVCRVPPCLSLEPWRVTSLGSLGDGGTRWRLSWWGGQVSPHFSPRGKAVANLQGEKTEA